MMINRYRKLMCLSDFIDDNGVMHTAHRTINLCDVSSYEEFLDSRYQDGISRVYLLFSSPSVTPINIRMSYSDFDKLYTEMMDDYGLLDIRSAVKKKAYSGPIKLVYDITNQYTVVHGYPAGYSFKDKTMDDVRRDMLYHSVTIMN
jgi:hypothetical protein